MINITLLGSGGGMPIPTRYLSSVIINYRGRNILIDCGEGTQVAMREFHSGFKSIDIICLTHYHGDHIFGLPGLLSSIGNSDRKEPITIIGPIGLKKIIAGLLVPVSYLPYELELIEAPKEDLGLNIDSVILRVKEKDDSNKDEIVVFTLNLDHSSPCLGYGFYVSRNPKFNLEKAKKLEIPKEFWSRLQNNEEAQYKGKVYYPHMVLGEERRGIKLSYITDTRPTDEIVDFIYGSDLFICEGTYGDDEDIEKAIKNKHMTFNEAAELALKGQVQELLLTHFSKAMAEPEIYKKNAIRTFENTILAYDGYNRMLSYKE